MYFPFRHDNNAKESMLTGSSPNLLDSNSTVRPFGSPFTTQSGSAPVFHHSGNIQGLHNVHGSYNMSTLPSSLSSRNSGLGGATGVGVVHQSGSLPAGRFSSNNLPVALSQMSHGGLHAHSGIGSRAGISVGGSHAYSSSMNGTTTSIAGPSPGVNSRMPVPGLGISASLIGGAGPRITSSVGSMISGAGSLGRTINSGSGLSVPNLSSSRMNLGPNNAIANLGMQGSGRPLSNVLDQASSQMVSLLGNNFSNSFNSVAQGQGGTGNGQFASMGLINEGAPNDGAAFDINDFPQLSSRPSSGGPQGGLATLRKQVGVNPIVQQSQEFSIQNEDFPALPGFKGGNNEFSAELHSKDSQHENALAFLQSQHFTVGRSGGFTLGGSYVPHRQQQQQQQQQSQQHGSSIIGMSTTSGSFTGRSTPDMLQLHAAPDLFQNQAGVPPGASSGQVPLSNLRGSVNPSSVLSSYDQLLQYQQQQSQYRPGPHQLSGVGHVGRDQGLGVDRFGLLGLLGVIRLANPDLTTLALGTDLTTLGLNLNSRDNLYKTFASPWAEGPAKGEPEFTLPQCYVQQAPKLQLGYFTKFQQSTLFYIFYSMPNDEAQIYAATELCNRGWFYHRELRTWLMRVPNTEPLVTTNTYERGSYYFFDVNTWDIGRKDNFVVHYEAVEKRPQLPPQHA